MSVTFLDSYELGEIGVDACPTGTMAITDTDKCAEASQALGYGDIFDERIGTKTGENVICNYCTSCVPIDTRVSSDHGDQAYWICEKSSKKYNISTTILIIIIIIILIILLIILLIIVTIITITITTIIITITINNQTNRQTDKKRKK